MESARDPELGFEKSQGALNEALLPEGKKSSGYSFTDTDGKVYTIASDVAELVPRDAYVQRSSDPPHVLEFKAEVRRLLSRFSLHRALMVADEETRRRMSRSVTVASAYHLTFVGAMCVAVFGGYVDGKPWSVAFWLLLVESLVLLTVLALKLVALHEHDNRTQPELCSLKLNFQNMPAVRERLGEQEFKDFMEPLQKSFDRICACLVEPVEPSFCDVVKSYFKRN